MSSPDPVQSPAAANDILHRVSVHLDGLAARVHHLEEVLAAQLNGGRAPGMAAITEFQALDFLRQSLEDCALLTLLLGRSCEPVTIKPQELESILGKLRLETTQNLITQSVPPQMTPVHEDPGDVDFF
jgi:hypothetical protein